MARMRPSPGVSKLAHRGQRAVSAASSAATAAREPPIAEGRDTGRGPHPRHAHHRGQSRVVDPNGRRLAAPSRALDFMAAIDIYVNETRATPT